MSKEDPGKEPNVYVYAIGLKDGEAILPYTKNGVSSQVERRISGMSTAQPFELFCEKKVRLTTRNAAASREYEIHESLKDRRVRGEWFRGIPSDIVLELGALMGDDDPYNAPPRTPRSGRSKSNYVPFSQQAAGRAKGLKKPFYWTPIDWSKAPTGRFSPL